MTHRLTIAAIAAASTALIGCDQQSASTEADTQHAGHDHAHDEGSTETAMTGTESNEGAEMASSSDEFGLMVGSAVPAAMLKGPDGTDLSLASLHADGPVVVTFYRGGWCPYCNQSLTEWEGRTGDLEAAGASLVALTPESPEHTGETVSKNSLGFTVLSDAEFEAADGFGIRFDLDDATKTKYQGYGIELGDWNASKAWSLPHPATYVIDQEGVIRWRWVQEDYTVRATPDEVIAAVNAL